MTPAGSCSSTSEGPHEPKQGNLEMEIAVVGAYPKLVPDEIREEHEENAGDEPEEEIPLWPALGLLPVFHLAAAHLNYPQLALCSAPVDS
jgi:hypothetical protein